MYSSSSSSSNESVDRISSLPDGVLLHILSFLDMRLAVLTGTLSSRWRGLWAYTQSLDFNVSNYYEINSYSSPDYSGDFLKFVDQSLLLHLGSKIHKFRLRFWFGNMYDPFIEKWLLFAIKRGVKQLYLDFPGLFDPDYKLPDWLFRCESLISLSVRGLDVVVPNSVCFSSLLSLTINSASLNPDSIPILLNGCPLLEDLVLEECLFYGNLLRISSSPASGELPLKRLTFAYNGSAEFEAISIEIEAPKLEILNLSWFNMYNNSLKNMFSLRQVYLKNPFASPPLGSLSILESWLKELHNVEVLKLCKVCIEVLSSTIERYQPSYLSKTRCLFLESQLRRSQLPGIANLLCRSQHLENLIVKLIPSRFVSLDLKSMEDDFDEEYLEWLKLLFPCMVSGLMTVKIYGFMGRGRVDASSAVDGVTARSFFEMQDKEIELVRFFLKNAVALKKMTIHFCGKPDFVEEAEWLKLLPMVAQKLTALPRASSCAELSFVYKC